MPINKKSNGTYRTIKPYIKVNGSYREITNGWEKVAGSWRVIYESVSLVIYTASSDNTVKRLDSDGNEIWSYTGHTENVNDVEADDQNNLVSVSDDELVKKLDASGNEIWSRYGGGYEKYSVAISNNYDVLYGDSNSAIRLDSSGNYLHTLDGVGSIDEKEAVAFDQNGNAFAGTFMVQGLSRPPFIFKCDPSGSQIWQREPDSPSHGPQDLACDLDDNVYAAWNPYLLKYDPDGNLLFELNNDALCVAVDLNNNFYIGDGDDNSVKKYDAGGTEVWSVTYTDPTNNIAVDSDGNSYITSADNTVRKLDTNGSEVWSFSGHTDTVNGIAVTSGTYGSGFFSI